MPLEKFIGEVEGHAAEPIRLKRLAWGSFTFFKVNGVYPGFLCSLGLEVINDFCRAKISWHRYVTGLGVSKAQRFASTAPEHVGVSG